MLLVPGSIVLILVASMMFGQVSGNEFCPQDFAYRSFRFNQIPFIQIQITPVYRNDKTNDLVTYLTTNKLLPPTSEKIRWDLTEGTRGMFDMATSGAEILQRYLSANDSQSSHYWKQWSMRHPEEAKVLWPAVAKLARTRQYPLVPEAFEAARVATSEKDLANLLAVRIAPQLHERALDASENQRPDEARSIWDLALELDPSQTEWRALRDALPPPEKVEAPATKEAPAKDSPAKEAAAGAATTTEQPAQAVAPPESSPTPEKVTPEEVAPEKQDSAEPKSDAAESKEKTDPAEAAPPAAYESTPTSDAAPPTEPPADPK